jgi:predicted nucleotidyltransferase
MKPSQALATHRDAIRSVVASHRACNPRVFGSVVHGDDTEDSDLDILIDPTPDTTLFDIGAIRHELLQLTRSRPLLVVHTERRKHVRIISARKATRYEKTIYEQG